MELTFDPSFSYSSGAVSLSVSTRHCILINAQASSDILEYRTYQVVHPLLKKYIDCIYSLSSRSGGSYYCVPNGRCGLSLILSGQFTYAGPEGEKEVTRYGMLGMIREPLPVCVSAGFLEMTIVFKAAGLQHFSGLPVQDILHGTLSHGTLSLEEERTEKDVVVLHDEVSRAGDFPARCRLIEHFLLQRFCTPRGDARVDAAVALIEASNGAATVQQLGEQMRVTPRTLHTLFTRNVGVSPKEYIRINRFYKSLCSRREGRYADKTLTEYAYCLGYYDQSHFTNDFKRFAGRAPHKYFATPALTNDFYRYKRWLMQNFEG